MATVGQCSPSYMSGRLTATDVLQNVARRPNTPILIVKRCAYELGSIPCARCSPQNVPSRKTLQKAGLVPFAHILNGSIGEKAE
jgi:hypothetical protein